MCVNSWFCYVDKRDWIICFVIYYNFVRVVLILLCNGFNINDIKNMCFYWDLCEKS